jgi:hypothetical protein
MSNSAEIKTTVDSVELKAEQIQESTIATLHEKLKSPSTQKELMAFTKNALSSLND